MTMNQTSILAIRNSNIDAAEACKEGAVFAEVARPRGNSSVSMSARSVAS